MAPAAAGAASQSPSWWRDLYQARSVLHGSAGHPRALPCIAHMHSARTAHLLSRRLPSSYYLWPPKSQVLEVVLGQQMPSASAGFGRQAFAVTTAVLGLASFALVLALIEQASFLCDSRACSRLARPPGRRAGVDIPPAMPGCRCCEGAVESATESAAAPILPFHAMLCCAEQVVLEVLESNVKKGSPVYEEGHVRHSRVVGVVRGGARPGHRRSYIMGPRSSPS
jgi:hypothetical protein